MESTILSITFNINRTYAALCTLTQRGLRIEQIDAISEEIDIFNDDVLAGEGLALLHELLFTLKMPPSAIHLALPPEAMLVQHIPSMPGAPPDEVRDMLSLEIMQNAPDLDLDDYDAALYPMNPKLDASEMTLAVMTEQSVLHRISKMIGAFGTPVVQVMPRQFATHSAMLYSHPELRKKSVVVFGIKGRTIETSVVHQSQLAYYNATPVANAGAISEMCDGEIEKVLSSYLPYIDAAYFYGDSLTREVLSAVSSRISGVISTVERLNPFRLSYSESLTQREREFCSRMAHAYAPC
ncbi:MAG: hypothetical protein JNL32_14105, partial [Candidatus Kapabacteria bacterium]|nr:hypothetical protein [Candidatus Kapabacteria bacterium]